MECMVCGSKLVAESDLQSARCPDCGIRYPIDALKGMSGTRAESAQVISSSLAESELGLVQFELPQENPQPVASPTVMEELPQCEAYPTLDGWKTSIGFSILGCALASVLCVLPYGGDVGLAITVIYGIATLTYLVVVYPSYFSSQPLFASVPGISFCNCLFGGYIFGPLWNHNLTIRKKGISHIIDGMILVTGALLLMIALLYFDTGAFVSSDVPRQAESFAESTMNPLEAVEVPDKYGHIGNLTHDERMWESKTYSDLEEALDNCLECLTDMGLSENEAVAVMYQIVNAESEISVIKDSRQNQSKTSKPNTGYGYLIQCGIVTKNTRPMVETAEKRAAEFYCSSMQYSIVFISDCVVEFDQSDQSQIIKDETKYRFVIQQID